MTTEDDFLDRAELRFVGLDVHIDVLQLPDPFPVPIDYHLAEPVGNSPLGVDLCIGLGFVWARADALSARALTTF